MNQKNIPVVLRRESESRKDYLLRVAMELIGNCWEAEEFRIVFDGAECDGACLVDDIRDALDEVDETEGEAE